MEGRMKKCCGNCELSYHDIDNNLICEITGREVKFQNGSGCSYYVDMSGCDEEIEEE
jgi:hypothetical protein